MLLSSLGGITIPGVEDTHYVAVPDGRAPYQGSCGPEGDCALWLELRRKAAERQSSMATHLGTPLLLKAIPASF